MLVCVQREKLSALGNYSEDTYDYSIKRGRETTTVYRCRSQN